MICIGNRIGRIIFLVFLIAVLSFVAFRPSLTGMTPLEDLLDSVAPVDDLRQVSNESVPVVSAQTELVAEGKTIAKKVVDDELFDTFFVNVTQGETELVVVFYHNSSVSQPVRVEGISNYELSENDLDPFERGVLSVPLVNGQIPRFKLHVGATSEVFDFGIEVITVQSYPVVGGDWVVAFATEGVADLTIRGVDGTSFGEDLEFLELKCGDSVLSPVYDGSSVFYPDYSCNETGYETSRVITSGVHKLEFSFGEAVDYAFNDAANISEAMYVVNGNVSMSSDNYTNHTFFWINASNIIIDCLGHIIIGNLSDYGVYAKNKTNITIQHCTFANFSRGIYFEDVNDSHIFNQTITNCNYSAPSTAGGSAIYLEGDNNTIDQCKFANNTASNGGGALYLAKSSTVDPGVVLIKNNYFENNSANISGGAIYSTTTNVTIINNTFILNSAPNSGAINIIGSEYLFLYNNTFINNSAYRKSVEEDPSNTTGRTSILGLTYANTSIIKNNSFVSNYASLGNGIYANVVNNFSLLDNSFLNTTIGRAGLYALEGNVILIANNTFNRHVTNALDTPEVLSLHNLRNISVLSNRLLNSSSTLVLSPGFKFSGCQEFSLVNNLFENVVGISIAPVFLSTSISGNITNNTFINVTSSSPRASAIEVGTGCSNLTVRENLINLSSRPMLIGPYAKNIWIINNTLDQISDKSIILFHTNDTKIINQSLSKVLFGVNSLNITFNDTNLSGGMVFYRSSFNSTSPFLYDFNVSLMYYNPLQFNYTELAEVVKMGEHYVYVNSSAMPVLNQSANVDFRNLPFSTDTVLVDQGRGWRNCPPYLCVNQTYRARTQSFNDSVNFTALYFSNYTPADWNCTMWNSSFDDVNVICQNSYKEWSNLSSSTINFSFNNYTRLYFVIEQNSSMLYSNATHSNITNSSVIGSNITSSILLNSSVGYSNITNSFVNYSIVNWSTILNSSINLSFVMNSSITTSNLTRCNVSNSTILNCDYYDLTIHNEYRNCSLTFPFEIFIAAPANNTFTNAGPVTFVCNASTPVGLRNITFNINGTFLTNNVTGVFNWSNVTRTLVPGVYYWNCTAENLNEMRNSSGTYNLTINESMPPDVVQVWAYPSPVMAGSSTNITANVTDTLGVDTVLFNITTPNGTVLTVQPSNISKDIFNYTFYVYDGTEGGYYNVRVIANDTFGNINDTETTRFHVGVIPPGGGIGGGASQPFRHGPEPTPPAPPAPPAPSPVTESPLSPVQVIGPVETEQHLLYASLLSDSGVVCLANGELSGVSVVKGLKNITPEQGYDVLAGPFRFDCAGQKFDYTANIPDNFVDVKVLKCRENCVDYAIKSISDDLVCGNSSVLELRKAALYARNPVYVPVDAKLFTAKGKVFDGFDVLEAGPVRVKASFSGRIDVAPVSTNLSLPLNPSLALVAPPVNIEFSSHVSAVLQIYYALPNGMFSDDLLLYKFDGVKWEIQESSINKAEGLVSANIEGSGIYALFGITCRACERAKLTKVYDGGSRNAVILVHGLTQSKINWQAIIDDYNSTAQPFQLWLADYPVTKPFSQTVSEFKTLLEANSYQFDNVYIVGHSLGGLVSQQVLYEASQNSDKYSFVGKVKKLVLLGVPNQGTPAIEAVSGLRDYLLEGVHPVFALTKDTLNILDKGADIPRVSGIKYYVIAGTEGYVFSRELFGDVQNDGIVSVLSASDVGGEKLNNRCDDYFDPAIVHTELDEHKVSRKIIERIISEDFLNEYSVPLIGYNKYVRVGVDNCDAGDVFVVVGKKVERGVVKLPLECSCGNGVCGLGEDEVNCPVDCAVESPYFSYRFDWYGFLKWLLILLAIFAVVLGVVEGVHHLRKKPVTTLAGDDGSIADIAREANKIHEPNIHRNIHSLKHDLSKLDERMKKLK